MKKRVFSIFLALVMVLCLVPTVAMAEGNSGTTTISLSVAEATYELVIPSKLTVANSGYNALGNGVTIKNLSNGDGIAYINVSATSAHDWNLTDSNQNKISYKLVSSDAQDTAKTTYSFTDKTSMATDTGSTVACGVNVSDYSNAAAGEYSDTVTWTANVVKTKTVTLTSAIMGSATEISAGQSLESDGVTITVNQGSIKLTGDNGERWTWDGTTSDGGNPFTFSTTQGNFTKIEIYIEGGADLNSLWTSGPGKPAWTGSASSVDVGYPFNITWNLIKVICTIEY